MNLYILFVFAYFVMVMNNTSYLPTIYNVPFEAIVSSMKIIFDFKGPANHFVRAEFIEALSFSNFGSSSISSHVGKVTFVSFDES